MPPHPNSAAALPCKNKQECT